MPQTLLQDLQELSGNPQMPAQLRRPLVARLHAAATLEPALDRGLAQLWAQARPVARTLGLQPALENAALGPALRGALLDSVEADPASANAALALLADVPAQDWQPADWQRLARVARSERQKTVPDKEVALLLARLGPPESLATLALTALREGPEDAEDRLLATAHLGRFADARVAAWIRALLQTGVATMECLQAASLAQTCAADLAPWVATLELACQLEHTDALARWTALDGLSHLAPVRALPLLQAALAAGGADLPPWFVPYCQERATAVQALLPKADVQPARVAPLPGLQSQVLARCPRIARRAAVLWREKSGDEALLLERAGIERALVDRRQLMASFLAGPDTPPAELGEAWSPNWLVLGETEHNSLVAQESAWLDA